MLILITKFKVTSRWSLFWIFKNNRTLEVNSKIVEGNYKRHNYNVTKFHAFQSSSKQLFACLQKVQAREFNIMVI